MRKTNKHICRFERLSTWFSVWLYPRCNHKRMKAIKYVHSSNRFEREIRQCAAQKNNHRLSVGVEFRAAQINEEQSIGWKTSPLTQHDDIFIYIYEGVITDITDHVFVAFLINDRSAVFRIFPTSTWFDLNLIGKRRVWMFVTQPIK